MLNYIVLKIAGISKCKIILSANDMSITENAENHHGFRHLARQKGFEPPTFRLGGGCSIQLSYWRVL